MEDWGVPGETPEEGEWPARDRVPSFVTMDEFHEKTGHRFAVPIGLRPVEMTPEMAIAGAEELIAQGFVRTKLSGEVSAIFQAMHAVAPVPLVSDAEIALTRERDTLKVEGECLQASLVAVTEAHDVRGQVLRETYEERDSWRRVAERLEGEKIVLRAELMAARDQALSATDAYETLHRLTHGVQPVIPDPPAPDPIANAIRPRETERRRIGG